MTNNLKKFAIALAAALGTATAAAAPYHNDRHYDDHHHDGHHAQKKHRHHPDYDRYDYEDDFDYNDHDELLSPEEKCFNAIDDGQELVEEFHNAGVGFIEGETFACKVTLEDQELLKSYSKESEVGMEIYRKDIRQTNEKDEHLRQQKKKDPYSDLNP